MLYPSSGVNAVAGTLVAWLLGESIGVLRSGTHTGADAGYTEALETITTALGRKRAVRTGCGGLSSKADLDKVPGNFHVLFVFVG